jgi:hypothetical protein
MMIGCLNKGVVICLVEFNQKIIRVMHNHKKQPGAELMSIICNCFCRSVVHTDELRIYSKIQ